MAISGKSKGWRHIRPLQEFAFDVNGKSWNGTLQTLGNAVKKIITAGRPYTRGT